MAYIKFIVMIIITVVKFCAKGTCVCVCVSERERE